MKFFVAKYKYLVIFMRSWNSVVLLTSPSQSMLDACVGSVVCAMRCRPRPINWNQKLGHDAGRLDCADEPTWCRPYGKAFVSGACEGHGIECSLKLRARFAVWFACMFLSSSTPTCPCLGISEHEPSDCHAGSSGRL